MEHRGQVTQEVIDALLQNLKKTREFKSLGVTPGKRVYAILEECLENMHKHSFDYQGITNSKIPYISAEEWKDSISIHSGNPVTNDKTFLLTARLEKINNMDLDALTGLYEQILNRETSLSNNGAGAGLGFILMKLKSGRNIEYSMERINDQYSFFELQISVKKYTMRKLIIDKTVNSPRVNFNPENNVFEISGESRPPDVASFYLEILRWFDDFSSDMNQDQEKTDPVVFNFDFDYFNSSSAKYILDFCKQIGDARLKGRNLAIKWHYEKDDLDMLQVGREMSKISRTPFEYVEKDFN